MKTHPTNWPDTFIKNMDAAIAFHEMKTSDPHNVGNAVLLSLRETRDAMGFALRGIQLPMPVPAATD